jgi:hypothetical protein
VVAGHEPVALTWHRGNGHAGLRERVEITVDGAHGAAALRRQVGGAYGGFFAQPHQDQQAAVHLSHGEKYTVQLGTGTDEQHAISCSLFLVPCSTP